MLSVKKYKKVWERTSMRISIHKKQANNAKIYKWSIKNKMFKNKLNTYKKPVSGN